MIDHVADILRFHPDARFIFMVRDGRDVAVSAKSSIFNHYHVYYSAKRWQREQRTGLDWLEKLSGQQIRLLKYEELTTDPVGTVQELCDFLDLPYSETMLEYHRLNEAKKSASLSISWENTAKPVIAGNGGKFRKCLSALEIRQFEAIATYELQQLGYATVNSPECLLQAKSELSQERLKYRLSDFSMKLMTETCHVLRDHNSTARIKKSLYMTYLKNLRRLVQKS